VREVFPLPVELLRRLDLELVLPYIVDLGIDFVDKVLVFCYFFLKRGYLIL
jgi:hypothetical protein